MSFPITRPRRLRRGAAIRRLVRETDLTAGRLIYPLFVMHGRGVRREIPSMPGCAQLSVDMLVDEAKSAQDAGVLGVILFGLPSRKDPRGGEAYDPEGIIPQAIHALKRDIPDLQVWADVCLCGYTDHGHCGVLEYGEVDDDATLPLLARASVAYGKAGADAVAPSDMMDGRVGAIRAALDGARLTHVPIVSYAAKYASSLYAPFRDAAESAARFGDRKSYQMDPGNAEEALREVALDLEEGADIVMVKPALPYLDVISRVKDEFGVPVAAYNVSGEYAMVKAAAERGWIDGDAVAAEILLSIRRAGADIIVTYFAKDAARILKEFAG
jgi:porphobilinogen synthase